MSKLSSIDELQKLRDRLLASTENRKLSDHTESRIQVKVAMATCGIASGAREVMNFMSDALQKRRIEAIVSQTGCMGYCYAEPTVEVTIPGEKPVVFGEVDLKKADEIIEIYIRNRELVGGVIPQEYARIDAKLEIG